MRDAIVGAFASRLDDDWFESIAETPEEANFLKQMFHYQMQANKEP